MTGIDGVANDSAVIGVACQLMARLPRSPCPHDELTDDQWAMIDAISRRQ